MDVEGGLSASVFFFNGKFRESGGIDFAAKHTHTNEVKLKFMQINFVILKYL